MTWLEPQDEMGMEPRAAAPHPMLLIALQEAAPALFDRDADLPAVDHPAADAPVQIVVRRHRRALGRSGSHRHPSSLGAARAALA